MDGYSLDEEMCRQCLGLCCQAHPGAWTDPRRFASLFLDGRTPSPAETEELLAPLGIVLRDFSGVPVAAPRSTAEGCVFLTEQGCRLGTDRRPEQCLALIPDIVSLIEGECHCRLPGAFTYGAVRQRWRDWWGSRET